MFGFKTLDEMEYVRKVIVGCVFISLFSLSTSMLYSQQVDVRNGVEYMNDKNEVEDSNSLSMDLITSVKDVKTKKQFKKPKRSAKKVSAEDIENLLDRGTLRYRKKRDSNKCFEEIIEDCEAKDEKELSK